MDQTLIQQFLLMQGLHDAIAAEPANAQTALDVNRRVMQVTDARLTFEASPSDYYGLLIRSAREAAKAPWNSSNSQ